MVSRRSKGITSSVSDWMDKDDHVSSHEVDAHLKNAWEKTGKGLRKHLYTGGPIRKFLRKRAVVSMAQHQIDGVEQRDVSRKEVKKRFKELRKSGEMHEMKTVNDLVMEVARNEFQSPRSANDKKRLAVNKESIKKQSTDHKSPVTSDDKNFKASNIKTYDRTPMHGYNPGDDIKVNEESLIESSYSKMSVAELRRLRSETINHLSHSNSPAMRSKLASIKNHLKHKGVNEENIVDEGILSNIKNRVTGRRREVVKKVKEHGIGQMAVGNYRKKLHQSKVLDDKSYGLDGVTQRLSGVMMKHFPSSSLADKRDILKGKDGRASKARSKLKTEDVVNEGDRMKALGKAVQSEFGSAPKHLYYRDSKIVKGLKTTRNIAGITAAHAINGAASGAAFGVISPAKGAIAGVAAGAALHGSSLVKSYKQNRKDQKQGRFNKEVYDRHHAGAEAALKGILGHLKDHKEFLNKHSNSKNSNVNHIPYKIKDFHRRIEDMRDDIKANLATKEGASDNNSIGSPQDYSTAMKTSPRMEKIKRYISSNKRGIY